MTLFFIGHAAGFTSGRNFPRRAWAVRMKWFSALALRIPFPGTRMADILISVLLIGRVAKTITGVMIEFNTCT